MTKVLVIDDDATVRAEILLWLLEEGYEAAGISEEQALLEEVLRVGADLIVYDIARPLTDGYEVWLEIHAHLASAQVPFVFVTAGASPDEIRKGMALGNELYITKPVARQDLLLAIQTRLQRNAAQELRHKLDVEKLQTVLTEEREQRMIKAKMVAMFSHDLRNPLTIIRTANQLLRGYGDRMDELRRQKHMTRIDAAVNQLLLMLDDMLVIAQLDAGRLEFNPELLPIGEFVEKIVEEFQTLHETTHKIHFTYDFTESILADPRLLRQIVVNLVSNAIKYSPQGGDVRVLLTRDAKHHYVLAVHDQGIGIPDADQHQLFQAFRRGSNVNSILGSGLGLSIVKQAVELHGGSVHLESQVNQGTSITVAFPYWRPS